MRVTSSQELPAANSTRSSESPAHSKTANKDIFAILLALLQGASMQAVTLPEVISENDEASVEGIAPMLEDLTESMPAEGVASQEVSENQVFQQTELDVFRLESPLASTSKYVLGTGDPEQASEMPAMLSTANYQQIDVSMLEEISTGDEVDEQALTSKLLGHVLATQVSKLATSVGKGHSAGTESSPEVFTQAGAKGSVAPLPLFATGAGPGETTGGGAAFFAEASATVDGVGLPALVAPDAFADTIVKHVRYLMSGDERTVQVRLVPPSLGELRITVTSVDDAVAIHLVSSNEGTRSLLQEHARFLRDAMIREGIDATQVTVSTGDFQGSGKDAFLEHRRTDNGLWNNHVATKAPLHTRFESSAASIAPSELRGGSLNLYV